MGIYNSKDKSELFYMGNGPFLQAVCRNPYVFILPLLALYFPAEFGVKPMTVYPQVSAFYYNISASAVVNRKQNHSVRKITLVDITLRNGDAPSLVNHLSALHDLLSHEVACCKQE